ncbi:MAG TPA: VOC family protein [Steroidobacteraceae bacterium]|nr:VOC family protein [Steroidobacteraceae bacterium]
MSRRPILGPVMQNAFVVQDLDRAIEHWTRVMGVGPFFLFERIAFDELVFRGREVKPMSLTIAIGYWDDLQIELIRQLDDSPSIYTEFEAAHGTGMHHMGVMSQALDADLAALAGRGVQPVQRGSLPGMRFAYVATDHHAGGMIELIEATRGARALFDRMREAAQSWDGRDPVRRVG